MKTEKMKKKKKENEGIFMTNEKYTMGEKFEPLIDFHHYEKPKEPIKIPKHSGRLSSVWMPKRKKPKKPPKEWDNRVSWSSVSLWYKWMTIVKFLA